MPRGWARDLFLEFWASPDLVKGGWDLHRRVGGYAAFFRSLGVAFASPGELTQEQLLSRFGAEGLRRQFQAVSCLVRRLGLDWDATVAEEVTEEARIDATLARATGQAWAEDLAAFRRSLVEDRPVAPRTARMYVAAAADLLAGSGATHAAELTRRHLERHLLRKPGQASNLTRFLGWVAIKGGEDLAKRSKRSGRPRARERAVLRQSGALLQELVTAKDPRTGRALLAAAISLVHGTPLKHVLALRTSAARTGCEAVRLWQGDRDVTLTGSLAHGFNRFAARLGAYTFPGRNAAQPLSAAAIDHQVKALGLASVATQLRHRAGSYITGRG